MDLNKTTKNKNLRGNAAVAARSETHLMVKFPDSKLLRVVSRSVFLALVFITFPCIGSLAKTRAAKDNDNDNAGFDFDQFDSLLRGLASEGLFRQSDSRVVVVSPGIKKSFPDRSIEAVDSSALEIGFSGEKFDLVYVTDLARDAEIVDRLVKKPDGIVAFPLNDNEYDDTPKGMSGYKIVYLRRFSTTIVAMRNMAQQQEPKSGRKLLESPQNKAEALNELEEALLEPPRRPSRRFSRKIKFLPELLGDGSLVRFERRVFVNAGSGEKRRGEVTRWFEENYPKMRQEFEVYDIVGGEGGKVSEWAARNVREEEYVVMKAEAEAVEEMVRDGTIRLVDELFLECNNEWWWRVGNKKMNKMNRKRAYWECLALYGKVKDEGVAVHQWWG